MQQWSEDLSVLSLQEALNWQAENMAWSKEVRLRANALVNNRLAKQITQEDYQSGRKQASEDASECRRRADLLNARIVEQMTLASQEKSEA